MSVDIPVLIVGGSLNGLTMALCLGRQGVQCMVVERHPATTVQYKFRGISPRSMEIFRSLGIEDAVRARDSAGQTYEIARAANLADPQVQWTGQAWPDASSISPCSAATVDQDRLEPVLRQHAEALGADIRFDTELLDFVEETECVRARIRTGVGGREEEVTARYLVAADGATSAVRTAIGIGSTGPGTLQHWMNIIFRTDLEPYLDGRRFTSCFVTDVNGTILPRDSGGNWLLALQYAPEQGERPEQFDATKCRDLVRKAAGRADVKADLVEARAWEVAGQVAARFCKGRVFLIGDAAHLMPPTGAYGGNSGIQDAHNLAWKLALVLGDIAKDRLLDSYDSERRPIAQATLAQALARLSAWFKNLGSQLPPPVPILPEYNVVLGQVYGRGAFAAGPVTDEFFEDPSEPSGRPGSRAPHLFLEGPHGRVSTLDLFGNGFVLLSGPDSEDFVLSAQGTAAALNLTLKGYCIGPELRDVDGAFARKYRVSADGTVLVRPDGIIAWRSQDASSSAKGELQAILHAILGRPASGARFEGTGRLPLGA